jgi:hypothetical protein
VEIWKTPLYHPEVDLKVGEILYVGFDPKLPNAAACIWHLSEPATNRKVRVVGTGNPIPEDATYRGSAPRPDGYVFHVFEETP